MSDQKVMRVYFQHPTMVTAGDILQCPACRWKFVVLPEMMNPMIPCPKCRRLTDASYYVELSGTGGIELTNWGKPEPKPKEAKPDADVHKRSRKRTTQQRP